MVTECGNCGTSVTDQYARVFAPTGEDKPRCCPDCPDKIRDKTGRVREARGPRRVDGNDGGEAA